ncbi:hypothetical protein BDFB_003485, partial [Asbolus verrucosus]
FEILHLVWKTVKFLAITPSSTSPREKEGRIYCIFHQIFMILLITRCIVFLIFSDFGRHHCFCKEHIESVHASHTLQFQLRHHPKCFDRKKGMDSAGGYFENDRFLKRRDKNKSRQFYLFVLTNVAIFVMFIYICYYYWGKMSPWEYWQQCTTNVLLSYMLYLYSFYNYVILEMILSRYKGFRRYLRQAITKGGNLSTMEVKIVATLMNECVRKFNEISGKSIALLISFIISFVINYLKTSVSYPTVVVGGFIKIRNDIFADLETMPHLCQLKKSRRITDMSILSKQIVHSSAVECIS